MDFNGKTVMITGAATGVGEGIAEGLHARGANLVLTGIRGGRVAATARRIDPDGARSLAVEADIRDFDALVGAVASAEQRFGALHHGVCNAGITGPNQTIVADYPVDDWKEVIDTDVNGTFYSMKAMIPAILRAGGGSIVALSSGNGIVGQPGMAAYTAAKHAVLGLVRTAALDYATQNLRFNAVGPGFVSTPRIREMGEKALAGIAASIPMGRLAERSEVADMVAFLLSDEAAFVTGGFFPVDGGYTAQ